MMHRPFEGEGDTFMLRYHFTALQPILSIRVHGRVVGHVDGDVFEKRVRGSSHFLRKPPAIAFDVESLRQAERLGASRVRVIDEETGNTYCVQSAEIWTFGFEFDRGYGTQIGLPLGRWKIKPVTAATPTTVEPATPTKR